VQLFRPGADNTVNTADDSQVGSSQTTTSSGAYSFSSLPPGTYFIKVTPPATHGKSGGSPANADNQLNNDNNGVQTAIGAPVFSPIVNLADGAEPTNDGDTEHRTRHLDSGLRLLERRARGQPGLRNDARTTMASKDAAELGISGLAAQLMATGSDNAVGGTGLAADNDRSDHAPRPRRWQCTVAF